MTDPVWEIKSPGVLWLPPTGIEIERIEVPGWTWIFQVKRNGERLPGKWGMTLGGAKLEAEALIRELLEMGIEP